MSVNSVNADGSLTKIAGSGSTDTSVLKGDFSVVESTSTATRAYSIGDCFIMETGQLVRATSAIAINDTIAIGTNVAATSVAELLDNKFNLGLGLPSGNINLSIIQANFKSSGIAMHYVAENDWEGWSIIIGVLSTTTVRSFIIISRRRIIYSYTTNNGTSWTTQTLVTAT